ncbi:hypothetical protein [Mesorhizobium sp. IMUNJ 23232]|uniref:hypothetical protein n=1 Tax=Mesorhizobium sp. IMUNJ 23232 TaxID=3376064 RepID=UPI0037BB26DA
MTLRSLRSKALRILWRLWGVDTAMPPAKRGVGPDLLARAVFLPVDARNMPQSQQPDHA